MPVMEQVEPEAMAAAVTQLLVSGWILRISGAIMQAFSAAARALRPAQFALDSGFTGAYIT